MTTTAPEAPEVTDVRYLVVGGGPGGLQMADFLDRAGRDYLVFERGEWAGTFFATFPRHRQLISINKRRNFFPEDEFRASGSHR